MKPTMKPHAPEEGSTSVFIGGPGGTEGKKGKTKQPGRLAFEKDDARSEV